ncbi:MAG: GNAT family N-acetyltransferase [Kibdelosporangium sp.]
MLDRLESYYDAVPRSGARAEDFGPLTLFVREGKGWPFYARPALGVSTAVTAADVDRVLARQRELLLPESIEWVAETAPSMQAAAEQAGLVVEQYPLMVLDWDEWRPAPAGVAVRIIEADDPVVPSALAVTRLAFTEPGTQVGSAGVEQLKLALSTEDGWLDHLIDRIDDGLTVMAAAVRDGLAICAGQHQPVGQVSEVVGIGTLPSARRRGLGHAVTAALVADARDRGVHTVFLSAGDDDVARIYSRIGFRRVGTAMIAEPPPTMDG